MVTQKEAFEEGGVRPVKTDPERAFYSFLGRLYDRSEGRFGATVRKGRMGTFVCLWTQGWDLISPLGLCDIDYSEEQVSMAPRDGTYAKSRFESPLERFNRLRSEVSELKQEIGSLFQEEGSRRVDAHKGIWTDLRDGVQQLEKELKELRHNPMLGHGSSSREEEEHLSPQTHISSALAEYFGRGGEGRSKKKDSDGERSQDIQVCESMIVYSTMISEHVYRVSSISSVSPEVKERGLRNRVRELYRGMPPSVYLNSAAGWSG